MDATLLEIVRERLVATGNGEARWAKLTLAACIGTDAVTSALNDAEWEPDAPTASRDAIPATYLESVSVEGFRGIGPRQKLEVSAGNGLTLVVGRNGSGKSSFAEALELLVTGDNKRWSTRSKVWKDGWRNLHHQATVDLTAEMVVEGRVGRTTLRERWPVGAQLEDGKLEVQHAGEPKASRALLNWDRALELYRPFLSYNELGGMFDEGPTVLHDRLSATLGLDGLVDAQRALQRVRLDAEHLLDAVSVQVPSLIAALGEVDDARARTCETLLKTKKWDLAAIQKLLAGPAKPTSTEDVAFRQLVELEPLDATTVMAVTGALRDSARAASQLTGTPTETARDLAALLQNAVSYAHKHKTELCPVCEVGALDERRLTRIDAQVKQLQALAGAADRVHEQTRKARATARALLGPAPRCVVTLIGSRVDTRELADTWRKGASIDTEGPPEEVATAIETFASGLSNALNAVQPMAHKLLAEREDKWRRLAQLIGTWLDEASAAQDASKRIPPVKAAEKWLKEASADIRSTRFAPVAAAAKRIWELLRQGSSVELEAIALQGSGTLRHPALDVEVDGVRAEALSVMSQGELHSIGLSLFLPRATLPESPFRFVVIDDPVQSMDPGRVDGLARVLAEVAQTRQVIVFTHDDRLPEAVARLDIPARVIGVFRREGSVVELRPEMDPIRRAIEDARVLALTEHLPDGIAPRLVPGFCRAALESACWEVIRRRRLGRGERYDDVDRLGRDRPLTVLAALAFFDDANRGGDVLPRINRDYGSRSGDTFRACNRGAHEPHVGDLLELVRAADELAARFRALK